MKNIYKSIMQTDTHTHTHTHTHTCTWTHKIYPAEQVLFNSKINMQQS